MIAFELTPAHVRLNPLPVPVHGANKLRPSNKFELVAFTIRTLFDEQELHLQLLPEHEREGEKVPCKIDCSSVFSPSLPPQTDVATSSEWRLLVTTNVKLTKFSDAPSNAKFVANRFQLRQLVVEAVE